MRLCVVLVSALLLLTQPAAAQTYVKLDKTATSPWTLPSDWPGWGVVACVGNGGGGSARQSTTAGGRGGGGGEFAMEPHLVITTNPTFAVQAGNSASNTTLTGDSVTVTCHPGGTATTAVTGAGGTGSTNTTHNNGGAGFAPSANAEGGGGGAAGNIAGAGVAAASNAGGLPAKYPAALACTAAVAGLAGYEWFTSAATGGGGGGCSALSGTANGNAGGAYGGGGSGAADGSAGSTGGAGGDAIIWIVYYPRLPGIALNGPGGASHAGSTSTTSLTASIYLEETGETLVVGVGACINGCAAGTGQHISTVTDTAGNSCTPVSGAFNNGSSNGAATDIAVCYNSVGTGSDTFTITMTGSVTFPNVSISQWRTAGAKYTAGLGASSSSSTGTAPSASTSAAAPSGSMVYSMVYEFDQVTANGQKPLDVPPTPWIQIDTTPVVSFAQYQVLTAPGVGTNSYTLNASNANTVSIAALVPPCLPMAVMGVGC